MCPVRGILVLLIDLVSMFVCTVMNVGSQSKGFTRVKCKPHLAKKGISADITLLKWQKSG